ncbi:MAG: hypothetical protein Q3M30_18115 [Candidatus Electrothrix sp. Rat3]|nr:hypothetical protein [Candidatus Electrothrix rattekaaiensis]
MKKDELNGNEDNNEKAGRIELSVPWELKPNIGHVPINISEKSSSEIYHLFIKERTRLHEIYIREQSKNKRIGLVLSFLLILMASLLLIFAPEGRETLSYWIGTALIIFSAGTLGFGRVWGKAANISFGADQDKRNL